MLTPVKLPELLIRVAGINAVFTMKYFAVHEGTSIRFGHYNSYERSTLAEDAERTEAPKPTLEAVDQDKPTAEEEQILAESIKAWEVKVKNQKAYFTLTKYDDATKTVGIPLKEVEVRKHGFIGQS